MKRLNKLLIVIILSLIIIPIGVKADGISVSPRSISLAPGGSSSFTITASNAAGRVDISSSNSSVASISANSVFLDNNSQTITVRAGSAGTATITVVIKDAATYSEQVLNGSYTVNVTVTAPPPPNNNNNNNTVINTNPITNNKTNNNNNNNSNKSGNTNLKSIEVEGYKLNTTDNVHYTLNVKNSVDKIKIKADAADSKAKVSGTGEKVLKEGDNSFQVTVTAENGSSKVYTIVVTRHDSTYYLNELDEAIAEAKDSIVITLKDNDILTKEHLDKIKKSKLNAYFVRKENNKTIYSWMFNSKNISNQSNINMTLSFMASNKAKLEKLTDYREGIYLNFSYHGNLPKDTIIRIYVGNKYSDGDVLNLYYLDGDKDDITYMKQEVKVSNGYAEISIDHCSDYFLTKATISGDNVKVASDNNVIPIIIMILLVILIICVIISIVIKNSSNNKEEVIEKEEDKSIDNTSEITEGTEEVVSEEASEVKEVQVQEEVVEESNDNIGKDNRFAFSSDDNNDIQNMEPVNEAPVENQESIEENTTEESSVDDTPMNDELSNTSKIETI